MTYTAYLVRGQQGRRVELTADNSQDALTKVRQQHSGWQVSMFWYNW